MKDDKVTIFGNVWKEGSADWERVKEGERNWYLKTNKEFLRRFKEALEEETMDDDKENYGT